MSSRPACLPGRQHLDCQPSHHRKHSCSHSYGAACRKSGFESLARMRFRASLRKEQLRTLVTVPYCQSVVRQHDGRRRQSCTSCRIRTVVELAASPPLVFDVRTVCKLCHVVEVLVAEHASVAQAARRLIEQHARAILLQRCPERLQHLGERVAVAAGHAGVARAGAAIAVG